MSDATELEQEIAELETALFNAKSDAESWRQQMMDREKNIFDLDKQLTDAKAEIARLTDQLTMAIGVGNGNAAQCDKLTAQCEDYRKALELVLPDVVALAEQNTGMVNDMTGRDDAYEHPECVCVIKAALAQGSLINEAPSHACPLNAEACDARCVSKDSSVNCKETP